MHRRHTRAAIGWLLLAAFLSTAGPPAAGQDVFPESPFIRDLRKDLDSADAGTRAYAIFNAGQLGPAALPVVPRLVELLADTTAAESVLGAMPIRDHVLAALKRIGPAADEPLAAGLRNDDEKIRQGVESAIRELGERRFVLPLALVLIDYNYIEPQRIAHATLQRMGEAALAPLLEALGSDDPRIRAAAAGALRRVRDARIIAPLAGLLDDPDEKVREQVRASFCILLRHDDVPMFFRSPDELGETPQAVQARIKGDERLHKLAEAELIRVVEAGSDLARLTALQAADDRVGPEFIPCLLRCLDQDNREIHNQALRVLGFIDRSDLIPLLLKQLGTEDAEIRLAAANALFSHRYQAEMLSHLADLERGLDDPDARVVKALLFLWKELRTDVYCSIAPRLMSIASGPDLELAEPAMAMLGDLVDDRANDFLATLLLDHRRQFAAAKALAHGRDDRGISLLIAAAAKKDNDAIRALGRLGDPRAVDLLVEVVSDPREDQATRNAASIATLALGQIGDARAVMPLAELLRAEPQRTWAVMALGNFRDPRAIPALIVAAGIPPGPGYQSPIVRSGFSRPFVQIGAPAVEPLRIALTDASPRLRSIAAYALCEMRYETGVGDAKLRPLTDDLLAALDDPETVVRVYAALTLGFLKDSRAVLPLVEVVSHAGNEDYYGLETAGTYLAQFGDRAALPGLLELSKHNASKVRSTVARGLAGIDDPRSFETLCLLLRDPDPAVRTEAVRCAFKLRGAAAVSPVMEIAGDESAKVRLTIAEVISTMPAEIATEPLARFLDDSDPEVRGRAAAWLGQFGDARGIERVLAGLGDPDAEVRLAMTQKVYPLKWEEPRLIDALIRGLEDRNSEIRQYSARGLGRRRDERGHTALLGRLDDWLIRPAVVLALVEARERRAIPHLRTYLDDPYYLVRLNAATGLGRLGDVDGVPLLRAHLDDWSPNVRSAIYFSLATLQPERAAEVFELALADKSREVQDAVPSMRRRLQRELEARSQPAAP